MDVQPAYGSHYVAIVCFIDTTFFRLQNLIHDAPLRAWACPRSFSRGAQGVFRGENEGTAAKAACQPWRRGSGACAKMEEDALESSSEEGSSLDEPSWVSWFCMLRNHEFFCEVDPAFVQDRFNLYGLKEIVGPLYGEAMTMILGYAPTGALVHQSSRLTPHWGASGPAPGLLCEQDGAVSSGRRALACSTRTLRLRCSCLCRTQRSSCPTRRSASTRYWRPRASSTG